MEKIKSFFKNYWKDILIYVVLALLILVKLPYSIYAPGGKIDLKDRYENEVYQSEGTFDITYISYYPGTIPMLLASYIFPSWDIVKNDDIKYSNETMEDSRKRDEILNESADSNSIYVAYTKAGYDLNITNKKIYVTLIIEDAKTDLRVGDQILEVDDKVFEDHNKIADYIKSHEVGYKVKFKVLRNNKEVECYGILSEINDKALIGISFKIIYEYDNNPNIKYKSKKNELGPSGGLMMSLYIYNALTEEDITHGKEIAGTGTIDIDGTVGEIDGVKYKIAGAYKKGVRTFIVPEENYEEAIQVKEKNKYDIDIIGVSTFDEALNKLKELK